MTVECARSDSFSLFERTHGESSSSLSHQTPPRDSSVGLVSVVQSIVIKLSSKSVLLAPKRSSSLNRPLDGSSPRFECVGTRAKKGCRSMAASLMVPLWMTRRAVVDWAKPAIQQALAASLSMKTNTQACFRRWSQTHKQMA